MIKTDILLDYQVFNNIGQLQNIVRCSYNCSVKSYVIFYQKLDFKIKMNAMLMADKVG